MTGLLLRLISNIFKALVGFCLAEACVDLAIAAVDKEQKYYEIAVDYSVQDQNKVLFWCDFCYVKPNLKFIFVFHFAEACVGLATAAVNKEQKYSEIAVVYSVQDQNEDLFWRNFC